MYHAFGTRDAELDPFSLFVRPEDLERQLRFLTRYFRPVGLEAFLAGSLTARSVLVTIDDGYASTLEVAAPLLRRHRVPAVLFVCPGRLAGTSAWMPEMPDVPLLSPDQVVEVSRMGIEIGAHGMDHRRLTGLAPGELEEQVAGSRSAIADLLGAPPRAFAYPEGLWDPAAVEATRRAGFEAGFSVHRPGGRFAIPRTPVTRRDSFATFRVKTVPGFNALFRATEGHPRLRRLAARLARQRPSSPPDPP